MGDATVLRGILDDGEWHPASGLREILGEGWARDLEVLRSEGVLVQEKRDRGLGGKARYSYRLCWPKPGTLTRGGV